MRQSGGRGFGFPARRIRACGIFVWTLRLATRSNAVGDQPVSALTVAPLRSCEEWTEELLPQKSKESRASTADARLWA